MKTPCLSSAKFILALVLLRTQTLPAATFLWNVASPGANNWNVNANWTPSTGNPSTTADLAIFGLTGTGASATTINNVVSVDTSIAALSFTNTTSGQWHVTQIPAGVTLTVATNITVGFGAASVSGLTTSAAIIGGGTLSLNGSLAIGNNGASSIDSGTVLDLSGLSNFVCNAGSATIGMGIGVRSVADFRLAAASNLITISNWNDNTPSTSSSGTGNLTLGAGTNVINIANFNIAAGRASSTVSFPGGTGGLRIRGVNGAEDDRARITLGNRNNSGGSGNSSVGTLSLNGHPVDIKVSTLTLGQSGSAPTGTAPGTGTVTFNTGTIDASNIVMAICTGTTVGVQANGTVNVGPGGTLLVGAGGVSLANQAAASGPATGNLNIGGAVISSGNIFKTTTARHGQCHHDEWKFNPGFRNQHYRHPGNSH